MSAATLEGLNIIETAAMKEQFRFPRTKKRRIRNKWGARPANWRPSMRAMVDSSGNVYMHPQMADKLIRQLTQR